MVDDWKTLLRIKLREALGARQRHVIAVLRETLAAIENAEAPPATSAPIHTDHLIAGSVNGLGAGEVTPLLLSLEAVATIIEREIRERRDAANEYSKLGREVEASVLHSQAELLEALRTELG
ncbi:hypothetical protein [Verrucomicrobium spinosum]|nr:hypothetical protein [Verrucomicrobium spinosum]